VFVCDVVRSDLLCELVKPTVDVATLGQPLQPLSITAADGGRTVYAVGQYHRNINHRYYITRSLVSTVSCRPSLMADVVLLELRHSAYLPVYFGPSCSA